MATNATFKIDIYGDTANFENSLKGINSAMSNLKGEASQLRKELRLDPTNVNTMKKLQANLAQQLEVTKQKASNLKQEMSQIDKSTPEGQKRWLTLQKQLSENSLKANALETDLKEVGQAIERGNWKADIDVSKAEGSINKVKKSFSALKEIGIGALRQIGSTAVSALGNGLRGWVSDAMSTQKAMLSLQNTMEFKGIGGGFQKLSSQMSKLATDTNANTEDTLKLATTFVGLGDTADVAGKKTSNLVKANQAFGGTGENLKGVVMAYGQMSAAGKVTAENINQLTDNNTALGSALKSTVMEMNPALKQYGSFAGASEKGAISVEMLDKAMEKLGKAGGNQITTIGDAWDSFNETMSLALLPTLQALTPVITALIDKMSGWGKSAGDAIGGIVQYVQLLWYQLQDNGAIQAFAGVWNNIKVIFRLVAGIIGQLIQAFFKVDKASLKNKTSMEQVAITIKAISDALLDATAKIAIFLAKLSENEGAMDALKVAIAGLAGAFTALKVIKVIKTFSSLFNAIKGGIGGIKTFVGIVKTASNFSTFVSGLKSAGGAFKVFGAILSVNPFVAIGVAIGVVVGALVYFFTQTKKGREVWADFVEFLKSSVESIKGFFSGLGTWFGNLWNGIVKTTKGIAKGVADSWNESVESIKSIWNGITSFFTGIVEGIKSIWNGITEFFTGLWNGIVSVVQTVFTTVASIVTGAYNWFVTTFQPLIAFYQAIFNLVLAVINLAFQVIIGVVKTAYNLVIGAWQGLVGWWTGIFDVVKSVVQSAFNAIVGFGQWAWNGIVNIWNAVAGFFSGVFNSAKNIVNSAFAIIGNFAQNAWNRIVSIWNAVAGFFSGIFNSAKNVVSGAFNAIGSFASNTWGRVSSAFSPVVSFFSNIFNSARNAVSNALGALGGIAGNAVNSIVRAFSGIVNFFSNIFGTVKGIVDDTLGGITNTINNITSAVNGVAGKVKGFFGGSMVAEMRSVNLGASGIMLNSASAGISNTTNTFNIQAGQMNTTALARAIKKEIDNGRAG